MAGFMAWQQDQTRYFGDADPRCESLHDPWPVDAPYNLVETSYFGFSIPDEALRCEVYHITRPRFNLVSGGIIVYRGNQFSAQDSEYLNYFNYMPMERDITHCRYVDGVGVEMGQPGHFRITYDDAANGMALDLHTRPTMPAAFRPKGGHFTQGMKNTGSFTVRGKTHRIDSYSSRDRSWGDPRQEQRQDIPQVGWHTAVFNDDLAFHLIAFNSPDLDPTLAQRYPWLNGGGHHIWGYVYRDGQLLGVRASRHRMAVDRDNIAPSRVLLEITDERGTCYELRGTVRARLPLPIWPNCNIYFAMTEWEYQGQVTFGETQTGVFQEFMRAERAGAGPLR